MSKRKYFFSPESVERLTDLKTTDPEFDIIDSAVARLADTPTSGYRIPLILPSLDNSRNLFRFDVGRFYLIYTYTKDELEVVTVLS
jgi:mRNA-degrading endonuclease RelE of RelBE toxin-antitoxin system